MTGFIPPVRRMQVQSGEPNNLRVGFRRATLRVIAAHGRVAAVLPRLRGQKTRPPALNATATRFAANVLPVMRELRRRASQPQRDRLGDERAWRSDGTRWPVDARHGRPPAG